MQFTSAYRVSSVCRRWRNTAAFSLIALCGLFLTACGDSVGVASSVIAPPPPAVESACAPNKPSLVFTGTVTSGMAKSYIKIPFTVGNGTERVEVSYSWTENANNPPGNSLTATTLDLGLWDQHGYKSSAGFRGWGGSRQGRIDKNQEPSFVQEDAADRGYVPGAINVGEWYADLGVAAVSPNGASYKVVVSCKLATHYFGLKLHDAVDPRHIANPSANWYAGDFHMHGFHSNPNAPEASDFMLQARVAKLDFLMVTEYVTGQHWQELGAMQRANPDVIIWPGREIITYFGHVNTFGETPSVLEYRHGLEDINLGVLQAQAKADGALFQVNHPTVFPPPTFSNLCRGCYFELDSAIDYHLVDTMELVNGPIVATADDIGAPVPAGSTENPFVLTAIQKWEGLLNQGFHITGVSGSDSKGVDDPADRARKGYGSSATMVYAANLSRAEITKGIRAGHAYIRTKGVNGSPSATFAARFGTQSVMFGDSIHLAPTDLATLSTTVNDGMGQVLTYFQNGQVVLAVPITSNAFSHSLPTATRQPANEGARGTIWRIEVKDAQTRTIIGNPIFFSD